MTWLAIIGALLFMLGILTRDGNMDDLTTKFGVLMYNISKIILVLFIIFSLIAWFKK